MGDASLFAMDVFAIPGREKSRRDQSEASLHLTIKNLRVKQRSAQAGNGTAGNHDSGP